MEPKTKEFVNFHSLSVFFPVFTCNYCNKTLRTANVNVYIFKWPKSGDLEFEMPAVPTHLARSLTSQKFEFP